MKILLIMDPGLPVPPSLYGGIERIVFMLANEYTRLGHELTLLAGPGSYCNGTTITFGINKAERSSVQKSKEILFVWNYLWRNRNKFDLVHNFGRLIYLLPILNHPVKKIMSYQRRISPNAIQRVKQFPNRNLTFTACSTNCIDKSNVTGEWETVYNCVDFRSYTLNRAVTHNAPLIFLGRLDRIKGAHAAIAVAKKTNNKLLIGGNIPETQDNYAYYKKEIEPLIDNEQVIFLGALDDVQKNTYLGQAKALLFPIEWDEPFGIVMIEAMACGTPVIAFNRGAVSEVVEEGLTGNKVNNVEEMSEAVYNIEKIDRDNCRKQAQQRFNIDKIASDYLRYTYD